jgi:hypothetical protein
MSLDSGVENKRRLGRLGSAFTEYVRLSGLAKEAARESSKYQICARCGMEGAEESSRKEFLPALR